MWRSATVGRSIWSTTGFVKKGDVVWTPVEVPGATYGVLETQGIDSVFGPLAVTHEITETKLDQAEIITRMSDYLTANRGKIKAIIGLGDLVTGSIKRVFDQVGIKAGEIPVVGWGEFARHGSGSSRWLCQCRHVAGSAGDQLCRALARGDGSERYSSGIRRQRRNSVRKK